MRNVVNGVVGEAGYVSKLEQKYDQNKIIKKNGNGEIINMNEIIIKGVPGDIKIENWYDDNDESVYLDVVVSNIFAASYIKQASKERLYVAKYKEKLKKDKYQNKENIIPLALETMGAMGDEFKRVLQKLVDRIATRKNKKYSIIMNQIRTKIIANLMKLNAVMVLTSIIL